MVMFTSVLLGNYRTVLWLITFNSTLYLPTCDEKKFCHSYFIYERFGFVFLCDCSTLRSKSALFQRRRFGNISSKFAVLWIICIHVVSCIAVHIIVFFLSCKFFIFRITHFQQCCLIIIFSTIIMGSPKAIDIKRHVSFQWTSATRWKCSYVSGQRPKGLCSRWIASASYWA